jgi:hypothetical protein
MGNYDTSENAYFKKSKTSVAGHKEEESALSAREVTIDFDKYSKTEVSKKVTVYARDKH